MKNFVTALTVISLLVLLTVPLNAQDRFDRSAVIHPDTLDVGGFGNVVAGVDFDADGKVEFYTVNNDWFDKAGGDLVPRIYKYEKDATGQWKVVWSTRLALNYQNTWPALASADLDQDGKGEIVWGPVNNFGGGLQPVPERIVVFETAGDGSDIMGVDNGDGTFRPNAQWTITQTSQENLRPFRWLINDIDGDNTDEIVACIRAGSPGLQIYSVDNIPDAADSTETWTLEFSGGDPETFYDVAILDGTVYNIDNDGDVYGVTYDAVGDSFVVSDTQVDIAGGGSWNSAHTVDINNDAQDEIIMVSWSSSSANDVYLLQTSGDSLKATVIKDVPSTSGRCYGGAVGDLDNDGLLDYVFGTRDSDPKGVIHRLEYQGGAIDDPNNWELTIIDFGIIEQSTQFDIPRMGDLDGDGEDEVLYTGTPRGLAAGSAQPLVILDRVPVNQPAIKKVLDVPNDQGRQVWVVWQASADDVVPNGLTSNKVLITGDVKAEFPQIMYNGQILEPVYRNIKNVNKIQSPGDITEYGIWRLDTGDNLPVQVGSTVAAQFPLYAAVVPTLGDGSEYETAFVVSAHTATPYLNWKSFPQTGTSEDNLVPAAPTNVAATPVGGDVDLSWDESPDVDFDYFSIRRGDTQGFDASDAATEVGTTTETLYTDVAVGDGNWFYRVVAFDFNGNQGELSDEVGVVLTGIEDGNTKVPTEFALHQNYPNPFNPETKIAFDLPVRTDLTLTIYNTLGQKVRTLFSDAKPAGSHTLLWDGTNDQGIAVSSGIYIYTIQAGEFVQSRKMTFMK